LFARSELPVSRDIDDGIDQVGYLDLGRSPGELDFDLHVFLREITPGRVHELRRHPLAREIRHLADRVAAVAGVAHDAPLPHLLLAQLELGLDHGAAGRRTAPPTRCASLSVSACTSGAAPDATAV